LLVKRDDATGLDSIGPPMAMAFGDALVAA
jgi:hypothetical protein